jgi:hypothetical protein
MDFWTGSAPGTSSEYDVVRAEEHYERFCHQFAPKIPPPFALRQHDEQWDEAQPKLPLQRQLFYIAVLEGICSHFRPTLLQDAAVVQELPKYKRILFSSQKKTLVRSAMSLLDKVATLHSLLGSSHTRFPGIIIPAFEAAIPLLCFYATEYDPSEETDAILDCPNTTRSDLFGEAPVAITRQACLQAVRAAQARLQTLADISRLAEVGAQTLQRLMHSMDRLVVGWPQPNLDDLFPEAGYSAAAASWDDLASLLSLGGHSLSETG